MTDLSIIIVCYRGWKRLTSCLDSLSLFTGKNFSTEVIVVDNRSDDDTIHSIIERFPKFRFVFNKVNGGFANGCNLGARNAGGKFLLFLNPDTVVLESELEKLLNVAKQNSDYYILSCKQVNENNKECISSGPFPNLLNLTGFMRAIFRNRKSGIVIGDTNTNADLLFPDWISGSVIMIGKDIFNNLGGFDEDFWMYYEDVDLCRRVHNIGGKIGLCKSITIEHNHGGSSRINLKTTALTKTEVHISRHLYISKHKTGTERIIIQSFLILNSFISEGFIALFGILFFFVPKLAVHTLIFCRLMNYYIVSFLRKSWISSQSVKSHKKLEN